MAGDGKERKIKVDIDMESMGLTQADMQKLRADAAKMMERMMKEGMKPSDLLFGRKKSQGMGSGRISIDGEDLGSFRHLFDIPEHFNARSQFIKTGISLDTDSAKKDVVKRIWEEGIALWEYPVDWQLGVGYNAGQSSWWFTAQYFDDESGEVLVKETVEITAKELEEATEWDDIDMIIERKLAGMQEKCEADLAAFEE